MSHAYNIPIKIQKLDENTEVWSDFLNLHCRVIRNRGSEYVRAGAVQSNVERIFEVRYNSKLKEIEFNTSLYRVVFNDIKYNVTDYDDFMERHINVKLTGLSYE